MNINPRTLAAMGAAIRNARNAWTSDEGQAMAALQAFVETASLNDWDAIEEKKP